jgi:hypothetical protein
MQHKLVSQQKPLTCAQMHICGEVIRLQEALGLKQRIAKSFRRVSSAFHLAI